MRKNARRRLIRNLSGLLCLCVCLYCGAESLKSINKSEDAELFLAELSARAAENAEPGVFSVEERLPQEEQELEPVDGDTGAAAVSPAPTVTPDPERESLPVEEITLDGGEAVADFFVKDSSGSGADLESELETAPSLELKGDGSVEILIYHTHTSEAYSESYNGFYYTDMQTRTTNTEMSVVAAGEALKEALEAQGFGVVHDKTVNDELYNGSYSRSWECIQQNLEEYPSIKVTIDLHRDSMTTESGVKYKPTAVINGEKCAQIMLIAGSDINGEWGDFPNWEENLRLILRVQQKATELYPDMMRPLNFSDCKYNMNATTGSMLAEIGTEVSTVSEAEYAASLFGEALGKALRELISGS